MTKYTCAFFTMLAGVLLLAPAVRAQSWSTAGSTCQPSSDNTFNEAYSFNAATFQFASGWTGTIRARCPVNNPLDMGVPTWKTLGAGYNDPDGTGLNYEVQVQLVKVARSTGVYTTIATFDSNSYGAGSQYHTKPFSETFDFTKNAYWVTIIVSRSDENNSPGVWFASLSN